MYKFTGVGSRLRTGEQYPTNHRLDYAAAEYQIDSVHVVPAYNLVQRDLQVTWRQHFQVSPTTHPVRPHNAAQKPGLTTELSTASTTLNSSLPSLDAILEKTVKFLTGAEFVYDASRPRKCSATNEGNCAPNNRKCYLVAYP